MSSSEIDEKSKIAVSRFLAIYEKHPQKTRFASGMFKLKEMYPGIWLSIFAAADAQEFSHALQWLKDEHNKLAAKYGIELLK